MKLSEHLKIQRENPEYLQAGKDLQLRMQIANAIIDSRIAKGWSQSDLAERIGTKQANISRIESGIANLTISMIEKIIGVLDIHFQIWGAIQIDEWPTLQSRNVSRTITERISENVPCEINYSIDAKVANDLKQPIEQGIYL